METRDAADNYVRYVYGAKPMMPVWQEARYPACQLYLREILYTGHGATDGAYKVELIRDRQLEKQRKDVTIDARLGFKMVNADLLRTVNISLNNQLIRSYDYQYEEGAFYKTMLKSISELDDAGNVFYTHRFDYYDDVNKQARYNASDSVTAWHIRMMGLQAISLILALLPKDRP